MNMHVQPDISGTASPYLLGGDIVRIGKSEAIGRVIEFNEGRYSVRIFGEPESIWGEDNNTARFTPDCLAIWMPTNERPVVVAPVVEPFDFERLEALQMKFIAAFEMTKDYGTQEINNGGNNRLGNHLELIGDTFGDMACEAMDMIQKRR